MWRSTSPHHPGDGFHAASTVVALTVDGFGIASDLARALVQDGPDRDPEAIRHLDMADRLAPTRFRNDPIARGLFLTLDRRARWRVWELDSLRSRFGVGGQGPRSVNT